jgi:8-oxo-dGTP diphosphatase
MNHIIPGSLCYLIRDDHILLLRRERPPYVGLWSASGGKMEIGETPEDTVIREIREETGYIIRNPSLRGIVTTAHWLLFIFTAVDISGEQVTTQEGELRWFALDDLPPMPPNDHHYLPLALDSSLPLFQNRYFED